MRRLRLRLRRHRGDRRRRPARGADADLPARRRVVRRARWRPATGRARRRPRGEPRRGRGRRGRDPASGAGAARLRSGPDELRGAAPGGRARRGGRGRRRSRGRQRGVLAFQAIGASTATFGEIRDRAELVVVWRADPAATNPRLLGRLRLDRAARGRGRSSSSTRGAPPPPTRPTRSSSSTPRCDFEALWALRALVGDAPLDRDRIGDLPLAGLDDLAERLRGARHVALIHGALDELGALALSSLVRDLSRDRHAVTLGAARRRQRARRRGRDRLADRLRRAR